MPGERPRDPQEHSDPTSELPEDRPGDPIGSDGEIASYSGRLLVASPTLRDPNFARTVVLILDHDHTGTLGVVLNRPLEVEVRDVLPDWTGDVSAPSSLFGGGPVATDSALAIGVLTPSADEAPLGWRAMYGRVGLVDLDTPVEVLTGALTGLRIFAGYAGWSPGQLEDEIAEGSWLVVDGVDDDLTTEAPVGLWSQVLRRQPGNIRLLATCPEDPSQN
ncbi:MAG TPA: YqgE/AlgH family protein [Nocardioidaceae bacterium]|jgi:putative transcriptional regulator|nr:YqgE/AlgH family protein [Nocardioidaceae bacterium]